MALSWIKRSKRPVSVDDLVAKAKYGKAIELMRKEFSQRYPTATERLRFADVLVLDGRHWEFRSDLVREVTCAEPYNWVDGTRAEWTPVPAGAPWRGPGRRSTCSR